MMEIDRPLVVHFHGGPMHGKEMWVREATPVYCFPMVEDGYNTVEDAKFKLAYYNRRGREGGIIDYEFDKMVDDPPFDGAFPEKP